MSLINVANRLRKIAVSTNTSSVDNKKVFKLVADLKKLIGAVSLDIADTFTSKIREAYRSAGVDGIYNIVYEVLDSVSANLDPQSYGIKQKAEEILAIINTSVIEKVSELSVPDKHQLRILKDTVRNPMKGLFLGGPTAEESEKILREKFHFTDKQIDSLKNS